jgi:hypothetical protein
MDKQKPALRVRPCTSTFGCERASTLPHKALMNMPCTSTFGCERASTLPHKALMNMPCTSTFGCEHASTLPPKSLMNMPCTSTFMPLYSPMNIRNHQFENATQKARYKKELEYHVLSDTLAQQNIMCSLIHLHNKTSCALSYTCTTTHHVLSHKLVQQHIMCSLIHLYNNTSCALSYTYTRTCTMYFLLHYVCTYDTQISECMYA